MINNKWEGGIEKGCLSSNTTSKICQNYYPLVLSLVLPEALSTKLNRMAFCTCNFFSHLKTKYPTMPPTLKSNYCKGRGLRNTGV
jgi:hypothetical protein